MKRPTAISLFTGAAGLDLGFEAAGFEIRSALDIDGLCAATVRANRRWPVVHADIHDVTSGDILKLAHLEVGEADVLIGGPPCQPFSKSGYWVRGESLRLDDPRAGTLEAYLRMVRDTLPRVFFLENVEGLVYRNKDEGMALLVRAIEAINSARGVNYRLSWAKVNAADFGVPQSREHVFVIGDREGTSFRFPAPTHGPDQNGLLGALETVRTSWEAIGDLEVDSSRPDLQLRGKWADLVRTIPEGHNYLWHTSRGGGVPLFGWRRRYWSFLLKLAKNRPSWTIQAAPGPATGPFHWENRRLSERELCRLQTFPDDYRIQGSLSQVQRQLGNAVPVALGEILARSIRKNLLGYRVKIGSKLVPPGQKRIPPPDRHATRLPMKYQALVGRYDPHPGTGRGYDAVRRKLS